MIGQLRRLWRYCFPKVERPPTPHLVYSLFDLQDRGLIIVYRSLAYNTFFAFKNGEPYPLAGVEIETQINRGTIMRIDGATFAGDYIALTRMMETRYG